MQVKNNPLNISKINWAKHLNSKDVEVANIVINKLRKDAHVVQKAQRASDEIFNILDEEKDPYMGVMDNKHRIEIDTDGQLEIFNILRTGDVETKPYKISNYNYILMYYYNDKNELFFIDVIFKKYVVKLYVLSTLGRI